MSNTTASSFNRVDPIVSIVCHGEAGYPYRADCECGHRTEKAATEEATHALAEAHRDDDHHGHAVIAVHPSVPTIPDIYEGMFDHCLTITQAQSEWASLRAGIPQWHDGGKTRGELARIAHNRWDALRNHAEAAAK